MRALARSGVCIARVVALVRAAADQLARQQARVAFERHPRADRRHAGRAGARRRRAAAATPACSMKATGGLTHFIDGDAADERVAGAVRELVARRPRGAERREGGADLGARERRCSARISGSQSRRPAERLDQLARQAERKVEGRRATARACAARRRRQRSRHARRCASSAHARRRRSAPSATVIGLRRDGRAGEVDAGELHRASAERQRADAGGDAGGAQPGAARGRPRRAGGRRAARRTASRPRAPARRATAARAAPRTAPARSRAARARRPPAPPATGRARPARSRAGRAAPPAAGTAGARRCRRSRPGSARSASTLTA